MLLGTAMAALSQARRGRRRAEGAFSDYDAGMADSETLFAVRRAGPADAAALAPLFDAYRQFYEQPSDLARAHAWLAARLGADESVVFLAEALVPAAAGAEAEPAPRAPAPRPLGFCQLYPGWCSVAAAPVYVLYDLYVAAAARRLGVGRQLMFAAQAWARTTAAVRLDLSTARTNARAQALYESLGWQRDDVFLTYSLALQG